MKRTSWSQVQADELARWHEERMDAHAYPPDVRLELTRARTRWLREAMRNNPRRARL